jgi:hypothetical protein
MNSFQFKKKYFSLNAFEEAKNLTISTSGPNVIKLSRPSPQTLNLVI